MKNISYINKIVYFIKYTIWIPKKESNFIGNNMKRLNLIFATDQNYLFGADGEIPWKCPDDLKYFQRITYEPFKNNVLVMGRKTFESLPKKLEGRIHVVISKSSRKDKILGADYTYASIKDFMEDAAFPEFDSIFVIGGAKIIKEVYDNYFATIDCIYYNCVEFKVNTSVYSETVYLDSSIIENLKRYPCKIKHLPDITFYKFTLPRHEEYQYLDLLQECLTKGEQRDTRNAITYSMFNKTISFDLTKGFPLLTTKKVFMRGIFEELLFFLKGETDSKILEAKGVSIWKPNTTKEFLAKTGLAYDEGIMGPMYGWQWKHFGATYGEHEGKGFNQLEYVMDLLQNDPYSRRILMTTYNPAQAKQGVLYPCHSIVIQFYCRKVGENSYGVSMNMYQRSVDLACGLPFNIASNALLLSLICNTLNIKSDKYLYYPDTLNLILGDIHIYEQHLEGVKTQLLRVPYKFPKLQLFNAYGSLEDYKWEDIKITDYVSHPAIKYEMVA
jgi:dihydrofolate reductase/thymidylate synthase